MTLIELIHKRKHSTVATAIPATPNTEKPEVCPSVASVATVAVAQPPREPLSPLQAGWQVVYMDHQWKLAGGCDDPDHGTVQACHWVAGAWTVTLTDGQTIPLSKVRSVGAVDEKGRLYGAWTVRGHGYDGEGPVDGRESL